MGHPLPPKNVRDRRYAREALGEPAADFNPLRFGDSVCPECTFAEIAVVASFGPTNGPPADLSVPETQLGRCEGCGESLRREVTADTAGAWQATGF
jgi:hypothetical protein